MAVKRVPVLVLVLLALVLLAAVLVTLVVVLVLVLLLLVPRASDRDLVCLLLPLALALRPLEEV